MPVAENVGFLAGHSRTPTNNIPTPFCSVQMSKYQEKWHLLTTFGLPCVWANPPWIKMWTSAIKTSDKFTYILSIWTTEKLHDFQCHSAMDVSRLATMNYYEFDDFSQSEWFTSTVQVVKFLMERKISGGVETVRYASKVWKTSRCFNYFQKYYNITGLACFCRRWFKPRFKPVRQKQVSASFCRCKFWC